VAMLRKFTTLERSKNMENWWDNDFN